MNKKLILIFLLIIIGLLPLKELLKPGVYKAHDFIEHAARLTSFYESLRQGNLIPRWGGNLNYTYGHPVLMFLYPLSNYLGSFFHFLGFNIIASVKILFGLSYLLSGLFMFLWISKLWNKEAGFMAAIFYLFAPYRFVNLYVRAALGEHIALMIIPLVCWFITELITSLKTRYLFLSVLSLALLILAHNTISLLFLPLILFYFLFLIFYFKKKYLLIIFILVIFLGFGLSAFFWFPAFWEGKYTLADVINTKEIFINNSLNWQELFISKWGYGFSAHKGLASGFMVSLSWFQWFVLVSSGVVLGVTNKIKKTQEKILIAFMLFYYLAALGLMIKPFSFLINFSPLLYYLQFPWRLLMIPVFISSFLAAYLLNLLNKKWKLKSMIIFTFLILLSTFNYWQTQGADKNYSDSDLLFKHTGTTETGESTPRWALRFQENYPEKKVQLVSGGLDEVIIEKWDFEEHRYKIKVREDSQIADNTLYFPGWKVWVDSTEVPVNPHDLNWRGVITYPVFQGEHQIVVKFTKTKVRQLSELISIGSLIFLLILLIWFRRKKLS